MPRYTKHECDIRFNALRGFVLDEGQRMLEVSPRLSSAKPRRCATYRFSGSEQHHRLRVARHIIQSVHVCDVHIRSVVGIVDVPVDGLAVLELRAILF